MAVEVCIVATTIIAMGSSFGGQLQINNYCPRSPPKVCVLQSYPTTTQPRFECFDAKGNSIYIGVAEIVRKA